MMETNRTSALVIPLATAATSPIDNPTKRRGRYPSCVIPFWKVRNWRINREEIRQEIEDELIVLQHLNRRVVLTKCRISELRQQGGAA